MNIASYSEGIYHYSFSIYLKLIVGVRFEVEFCCNYEEGVGVASNMLTGSELLYFLGFEYDIMFVLQLLLR